MSRKRTHEEFESLINKKYNGEYILKSIYTGVDNKIQVQHTKCGRVYEIRASNLLRGDKCAVCYGGRIPIMSHNNFLNKFNAVLQGEYELLSTYKNSRTNIKVKHNSCGHEFDVNSSNLLRGKSRCPNCFRSINKIKSTERFKECVKEKSGNKYTVLSNFTKIYDEVKIRDNTCAHEFTTVAFNLLRPDRSGIVLCPVCNPFGKSVGEKVIEDYLIKNNFQYEKEKTFKINNHNYRFDFLINDNILLEFHGVQHFKIANFKKTKEENEQEFKRIQESDTAKKEFAVNNNFIFLETSYVDLQSGNLNEKLDFLLRSSTTRIH